MSRSMSSSDSSGSSSSSSNSSSDSSSNSRTRMAVLGVLVLQNCGLILTMRHSRQPSSSSQQLYLISTAVLLSEGLKLCGSLLVHYRQPLFALRFAHLRQLLHRDFVENAAELLKLTVPSGLYVVQNNLQYVSASNLPASVFQVLTQLKIVTTAMFSVVMLSRQLSRQQWMSILCLSAGVGLVQVSQQGKLTGRGAESSSTENYMLGVISVLLSCMTSGFAGVYFEKVLKSGHISLWLRNVHLSLIGLCLSAAVCYVQDYEAISRFGFFQGYNSVVWTVILLQAGGGLVVATVVMYADNVLKGFATSFSVVLSCIFSAMFLEDENLNIVFICGAVIVVASAFVYSLFPKATNNSATVRNKEDPVGEKSPVMAGENNDGLIKKTRENVSLEQRVNIKKKDIDSLITV